MLARVTITIPFNLAVKTADTFPVYEYETHGYKVRALAPLYMEQRAATDPDEIKVDGEPAVLATVLRFDFHRESFDRTRGGPHDPPRSVIKEALFSFLIRLRHVTRSPLIRFPTFPECNWRLEYTNDDGTPFPEDPTLARIRGAAMLLTGSFVQLGPESWRLMHELPEDFEPPAWSSLILDAQAELPKIGTAIVLAATALELFIATILDTLAKDLVTTPGLWEWINNRKDHRLDPSPAEQFNDLLRAMTGHSLKDEPALWEAFQNLKEARNKFVHEGTPRIGTTTVDERTATTLVTRASEIIEKVREWLPPEHQWPVHRFTSNLEITKTIGTALTEDADEQQDDAGRSVDHGG